PVAPEIVGVEQQENTTAGLVADARSLLVALRLGQQQTGFAGTGRCQQHPALASAHVGVLDQFEAECAGVPGDRLIVIGDQQRQCAEMLFHFFAALSLGSGRSSPCSFFVSFARINVYASRMSACSSAVAKRCGSVIDIQRERAKYGAGMMPGWSVNSRNRSSSTLKEIRPPSLPSDGVTANILPPTLNTRSAPHLMSRVTPGHLPQSTSSWAGVRP